MAAKQPGLKGWRAWPPHVPAMRGMAGVLIVGMLVAGVALPARGQPQPSVTPSAAASGGASAPGVASNDLP
ncbi:hypothetical protein, partial [Frankia sp. CiP3]